MPRVEPRALLLLPLLLLLACAGGPGGMGSSRGSTQAVQDAPDAQLPELTERLERQRAVRPRDFDTRIALGIAHYRLARVALDRDGDEERYLGELSRALDELVTAVELDPRNPEPHTYLAAIDLYRGDLPGTFRNLSNARRLDPSGVSYSNIAEAWVYRGMPERARQWNEMALRRNAPYGAIRYNDMFISWSEGDVDRAREHFRTLQRNDPAFIRQVHMAPLPSEPRSFEEFASYCCESPACGPYLKRQCRALSLEVSESQRSQEALLQELRLEIEKQRRMREVYEQRKELEIEVGEEE